MAWHDRNGWAWYDIVFVVEYSLIEAEIAQKGPFLGPQKWGFSRKPQNATGL